MTRRKQILITGCMALLLCSSGCRTGKIGTSGLFGFRGEPSADALAGSGPTTTYPAPPSDSATPEAIASIAGGTVTPGSSPAQALAPGFQPMTAPATDRIAAAGGTPSYASPNMPVPSMPSTNMSVPNVNMSAARANGMTGNAQPVGFRMNPSSKPSVTVPEIRTPSTSSSGYQFGSNSQPSTNTTFGSPVNMPVNISLPKMDGAKVNSFVVDAAKSLDAKASTTIGGMTLPDSVVASLPASKSSSVSVQLPGASPSSSSAIDLPQNLSDLPRQVSNDLSSAVSATANAVTNVLPTQLVPGSVASPSPKRAYTPGSTAGSGYPQTSSGYPATSSYPRAGGAPTNGSESVFR